MSEKVLELSIVLNASVSSVWKLWTTEAGVRTFFAPAANIELKPGGAYEIFFFPENPPGSRGADNQSIMAFEEEKMLSFTWNFTPELAEIRDHRTLVILRFEKHGESGCRLSLTQTGWGEGESFQKGFEYFKYAWGEVVLPRLAYSIEKGSIDWSKPPTVEQMKEQMKAQRV